MIVIDKIDTMSHMSKLIMYLVAIVIAIAMCIYFAMKADDLFETAPNEDQTYESDKNDEIEPHEEAVETVDAVPEEHTDI